MSSLTAVHQYREKTLTAASKLFEIGVLADAPDDESFILRLNTLVARRRTDADKNAPVDLSDAIKADGALKAQAELIVLGRWLLLEGHPGMKRQGGPQPDPRRILKGVAAILAELHTRPLKTKHDIALGGRASRKQGITKHDLAKQWDVLFGDKITPSMFDSLLRSLQRILPLYLKHLKSGAASHAGMQIKKSPEIKRVLDAISGILPKSKKKRPDILAEPDVKHPAYLLPFEIELEYQSAAHEEEYRKLPKGTRPIARLRYVPKITSATSTSGTIRADRDGKIVLIPEVDSVYPLLVRSRRRTGMASTQADEQPEVDEAIGSGYTAVLYVHGMGNQRRFEEVSRLIDAIDTYLSNSFRQRGEKLGYLAKIKPRLELCRASKGDDVTYVRTLHANPNEHEEWVSPETRYYEIYWAPVMAGMGSPGSVIKWILRQAKRPLQTRFSPWRERHRLRRSTLAELYENELKWPGNTRAEDFDKLLRLYSDFERLDVKRDFPEGSFEQFLSFIGTKYTKRPETTKRLIALAQAWHRAYILTEARNLFFLMTILLAMVLTGGLLIWSILSVMQLVSGLSFLTESKLPFAEYLRDNFHPSVSAASGLLVNLLIAFGLGKFLTNYMGDVEAWVTYEETDEKHIRRRRVLDEATRIATHVLLDPRCERVVVISHSLGTSVAHDTLLTLARNNRARNPANPISGPVPLEKIRHFVTIASPIDKINYFFESTRSAFHRYLRIVDTLRGDISEAPFAKNRKPHIHWVNFWDQADIISGPLHSPVGRRGLLNRVDNFHVANLHAPDPGASHSAYFGNRAVISRLFDMIYRNRYSFGDAPLREDGKGHDYDRVMLGPGENKGLHLHFFRLVLALPWLGLAYIVFLLLGAHFLSSVIFGVIIAVSATMVISVLMRKLRGARQDL